MKHHHHHNHSTSIVPEPPQPGSDESQFQRYQQVKKVTLIGAATNVALAILKVVTGYIGQSQALIADGIHSLSDLASDSIVLLAAKHGSRSADDNHPYGHARIETVFTFGLGVFLIVIALGIVADAVIRLTQPDTLMHPGYLALVIAFLSIFAKEWLYRYTLRVSRELHSGLLKANAWHHRSDAISSVVVVIGISGSLFGIHSLDALAAIVMALFIIKIGWDLCAQSLIELVDTALDSERVQTIADIIQSTKNVRELHSLRTRQMGGKALVDVHILVDPKISVSEGHYIAERVRYALLSNVDEVTDVMIHIDPEDDEYSRPSSKLPTRDEVLNSLKHRWRDLKASEWILNTTLHYLDGEIHVELLLPLDKMDNSQQARTVAKQLTDAVVGKDEVASIKVMFV